MPRFKRKHPKHVLITGATRGIGRALAEEYAREGVTLSLCGRNEILLARVAETCCQQGAQVFTKILDVRDKAEMHQWIEKVDEEKPIDLVIANAGICEEGFSEELVERTFQTNVMGTFNTIHPVIEKMKSRREGQVGIVSSMAGFRGFSSAPAYSSSKATLRFYGEALRGRLSSDGIAVSVISPGFVDTAMTQGNDFYMPFLVKTEKAAKIIKNGLARNQGEIAFPKLIYWFTRAFTSLPGWIFSWFSQRLPQKE